MKLIILIISVLLLESVITGCVASSPTHPLYVTGVVQRLNGTKLADYEVALMSNPNNLWIILQGGMVHSKIGMAFTSGNGEFKISLPFGKIPPGLYLMVKSPTKMYNAVVVRSYLSYKENNKLHKDVKVIRNYSECSKLHPKLNSKNVIIVPDDF